MSNKTNIGFNFPKNYYKINSILEKKEKEKIGKRLLFDKEGGMGFRIWLLALSSHSENRSSSPLIPPKQASLFLFGALSFLVVSFLYSFSMVCFV